MNIKKKSKVNKIYTSPLKVFNKPFKASVKPFKASVKPFKATVKSFKETTKPVPNKFIQNKKITNILRILNLLPNILFAIVNILKANKLAIVPAMVFIKAFIASEPLKNNGEDDLGIMENKLDNKAKNFLMKFSQIFLQTYHRTPDIDKVLLLLAFIDIITNEIPNIMKEANKSKYIDTPKIFNRLIVNAKDLDKEYNK